MRIQILPDPEGGHMVCASQNRIASIHLAHGKIPIPEGPVRRLTLSQAAQMAARWEAFLERQERLEK